MYLKSGPVRLIGIEHVIGGKVTDVSYMFYGIKFDNTTAEWMPVNLNLENVIYADHMFEKCKLVGICDVSFAWLHFRQGD